jgi:tetratricopeptide (TPR) repeat protein
MLLWLAFFIGLSPATVARIHGTGSGEPSRSDPRPRSFGEMDSLIFLQKELLRQSPDDTNLQLYIAELYFTKGAWKDAEEMAEDILSKNPGDVEARFRLAQIYKKTYRFPEAENTLIRLLQQVPYNAQVKLALVELYILKEEITKASRILEDVLISDPLNARATSLKAAVLSFLGQDQAAKELYQKTIEQDEANDNAYCGLAKIYLNEFQYDLAMENAKKALQHDFFSAEAHTQLGYAYFKKGDLANTGLELRLALRCDQYSSYAHKLYGRGVTDLDYSGYPTIHKYQREHPDLWKKIVLADSLIWEGQYEIAKQICREVSQADTENIQAPLRLGSIFWMQGNLDSSLWAFQRVLTIYPDLGLAHSGMFAVLSAMADVYRSQGRKSDNATSPNITENYSGVEAVFTNYAHLPKNMQNAVLTSIEPFSRYLPALAEAGATFYILPLQEKLTDDSTRKFLEGTRTFDLRLWDDIRGNGGLHATAGISSLWDVLHYGYNELAHEFAHQVHIYSLADPEKEEIRNLFRKALTGDRCLDDYAQSDEFEYFAVGAEAYVSLKKKSYLKGYHGHTRTELKNRDPELYALIENLSQKRDVSENILAAKIYRGDQWIYSGRIEEAIKTYKTVLSKQPDYIPGLNALGKAYILDDSADSAIQILESATAINPASAESWLMLGRAFYIHEGNLTHSIGAFEKGLKIQPEAVQLHLELGNCLEILGELKEAVLHYHKALHHNPNLYEAAIRLAECQIRLGYLDEADSLLSKVLERKKSVPAFTQLALLRLKQGSSTDAETAFRMATELDSENLSAKSNWGAFLCTKGEVERGMLIQKEIVEKSPGDLHALINLADCQINNQMIEEAKASLTKAESLLTVKYKPTNRDIQNLYEAEIPAWEKAEVHFLRGKMLVALGNDISAVTEFETALGEVRFFFDADLELFRLHLNNGEMERARLLWEKMSLLNPGPYYAEFFQGKR